MGKKRKSVTRDDVARRAGVSGGVVSRVFGNSTLKVSDETRRRVLKAASELGYTPNQLARRLVSGKAFDIGIAFYDLEYITQPFFSKPIQGIAEVAAAKGYGIRFLTTSPESASSCMHFQNHVLSRQVDGIIFHDDYLSTDILRDLSESAFPFVTINRETGLSCSGAVLARYSGILRDSIHYLQELGHTRIGLLTPRTITAWSSRQLRQETTSLRHEGLEIDVLELDVTSEYHAFADPPTAVYRKDMQKMLDLLQMHPGITALLCDNDRMACFLYRMAKETGLRIPEDLSVIGINNDPAGVFLDPPLTTNDLNLLRIGNRGAKLLFDLIGNPESNTQTSYTLIDSELIIRRSCSPPVEKP